MILSRKRTVKQKLRDECDKLWRQAVQLLAGASCEWCDNLGSEAHHMIRRSHSKLLRHALGNGVWLCIKCHRYFHHGKANADRCWSKFLQHRPHDYDALQGQHEMIRENEGYLRDVLLRLENLIEGLTRPRFVKRGSIAKANKE